MTRPPDDTGGGAMTGATGDLTPDDSDAAFVPGELREVADPAHQAEVTAAQGRAAPAQHGETGDPGMDEPSGGPTELAGRESGYGSEAGLSPGDPAYRMERRERPRDEDPWRRRDADGDEFTDHEEHF
jgi:hypothetical protein